MLIMASVLLADGYSVGRIKRSALFNLGLSSGIGNFYGRNYGGGFGVGGNYGYGRYPGYGYGSYGSYGYGYPNLRRWNTYNYGANMYG